MPVDVEHALTLACGATASAVKAKCGSDRLNSPQLQEPSVIKDIAPGPTRAVSLPVQPQLCHRVHMQT